MKKRINRTILVALLCVASTPAALAQAPNAWQVADNSATTSLFYRSDLSTPIQQAATNGGWSFTVNSRFVGDAGSGSQTMLMIYGDGKRRWEILWSLSGGDLQAYVYSSGGMHLVTTGGTGTNAYHTHQMVYDPTNQTASYLVDGQVVVSNWTGNPTAWTAGRVAWGSGSAGGVGTMNFHSISFATTNGVVASYDAGTEGNPAVAPDPTNSPFNWTPTSDPPPANITVTNVSPDTEALLPVAGTLAADNFTTHSARLNGLANASGSPTTTWFEWGTDTNYGNTTVGQDIGNGTTNVTVTDLLGGLAIGPDYHFRLIASNAFGVATGSGQAFNLADFRPVVETRPADQATPNSARVNGVVNPNGLPTTAWFEWGTDTNYGNITAPQNPGSGSVNSNLSATLSGLGAGPDYHYRVAASNEFGVALGNDLAFNLDFQPVTTSLPDIYFGSIAWADYDGDGSLDVLMSGATETNIVSQLWRNTGNGFTNVPIPGLPEVVYSSVAWADYDNDGRPDFLIMGDSTNGPVSQLWRNTGSGFTNVPIPGFTGLYLGSVAWADYDNDGRPDFLITGTTNSVDGVSQLWRNTGDGFTNVPIPGLPEVYYGSAAWADYDNDGRPDFLITGTDGTNYLSQLWRNTGNGFTNVPIPGLPGLALAAVAWADYDNDGRPDFLITGFDGTNTVTQLWRNTGGGFTNVPIPGLPQLVRGAVAWVDFDHDGRPDFLITGTDNTNYFSQLWRNTGGGFTNVTIPGLPGVAFSSVAWADYDNDGRPDFLITGTTNLLVGISQLWRNNSPGANTAPSAPAGLMVTPSGPTVILNWNSATDPQTPSAGVTYNVRVGTSPGANDVVSPLSLPDGFRELPQPGNAGQRLSASVSVRVGQTYYWSVQAVDSAFAGSPFTTEQSFTLGAVLAPPDGIPVSGDLNGDGMVDPTELNTVISNYWQTSPPNVETVSSPSNTVFQFGLMNLDSLNFQVLATTNLALPLTDWTNIGAATLNYQFTDPDATNYPQRFYQLVWP